MNSKASYCSHFESCSAPLCPLKESQEYFWYPDEEVCTKWEFSESDWTKNQKKIAKKVRNRDFYFTQKMLERNCIITVATEGLDPDKSNPDDKRAINEWLRAHPEKRLVSETERENARNRMIEMRKGLPLFENTQKRQEECKKTLVFDGIENLSSAK